MGVETKVEGYFKDGRFLLPIGEYVHVTGLQAFQMTLRYLNLYKTGIILDIENAGTDESIRVRFPRIKPAYLVERIRLTIENVDETEISGRYEIDDKLTRELLSRH